MSEWEPATDAEVAMRDALRTDDQESYFRILAGVDLLLPVSEDALAGLAPLGWGTWSTGGRTHVLAFTSQAALRSCLSDYSGTARRVPYSELATTWPNLEWWLAVNPGLPVEGYLPAWFVAQLARGDLRMPTRGPGREAQGGSKIQELGAAALAASRHPDQAVAGGPTYDPAITGTGIQVPAGVAPQSASMGASAAPTAPPVSAAPPVPAASSGPAVPAGFPAPSGFAGAAANGYPGGAAPQGFPPNGPGSPAPNGRAQSPAPSPAPNGFSSSAPASPVPGGFPQSVPAGPVPGGFPQSAPAGPVPGGFPQGSPGSPAPGGFSQSAPSSPVPGGPSALAANAPAPVAPAYGSGYAPGQQLPTGPGGLPMRTPSGTSQSDAPARSHPGDVTTALPIRPPAGDAAASPTLPRDFPAGPAAAPGFPGSGPAAPGFPGSAPGFPGAAPTTPGFPGSDPASAAPASSVPASAAPASGTPGAPRPGAGMATPGWEKPGMPFSPEQDPRGPLQDLNAPLPVRTPMANTPPRPEHVAPYDPTEAQVDPRWAAHTGGAPASAPGVGAGQGLAAPSAPPLAAQQSAQPLAAQQTPAGAPSGFGGSGFQAQPPGHGAQPPAFGSPAPGFDRQAAAPSPGFDRQAAPAASSGAAPAGQSSGGGLGAALPRRQPGQNASSGQFSSMAGFVVPGSAGNAAPPAPAFPQGPASPQALAAQSSPAPGGGSPGFGGDAGNGLPRRQVTSPSEQPGSMAAAAQALNSRPPAIDSGLPQRESGQGFGPSGPAPSLQAHAGEQALATRPGLVPPVIPGSPSAGDFGTPGMSNTPGYAPVTSAPGYGPASSYGSPAPAAPAAFAPPAPIAPPVPPVAVPGPAVGMPPQGSPAAAYAAPAANAFATQVLPIASSGYGAPSAASNLGIAGSATGGPQQQGGPVEEFAPANDVERDLQDAADTGNTDLFLSTLLLANVLVPVASHSRPGSAPGESGFAFQPEEVGGERYLIVFTSKDRLSEHYNEPTRTVGVRFYELIRNWPDPAWSFAVNPGTRVGAKYPGAQIIALANWATEAGLGAEPSDAPIADDLTAPVPVPQPASDEAQQATVMQKTIAAEQVDYYLERGYDRVAGFVHRASEVEHLRTPAELFAALGLHYETSPFQADAKEAFVLRWPAYRPSLYRIPYGGQNEQALRAMDGWVIERAPFRGNGFASGDGRDVIAEFKVDSVRLPHGAQLWRIDAAGDERMLAIFDADGPKWRRVGEQ
ncbi:SseB family protein [Actinoplanes sp. NBRC 101535]|uniref:SseB family protein n=1 Tax=Actinoplanes sp. NBRC 101535 TaxID=3032196 RepID=UPI0024A5F95B|nr:SseB family protein [Actinoplanes sp. NBRC 101535]GLY05852.1 hypothetical protein Acsp01_62310 [Actinoplanes sp. NBRC 101535]